MATYCLDITSFRGWSIGATHYYGKINMTGVAWDHFRPVDVHYTMTEADAAKLNEKEDHPFYEAGMQTTRFDTKELVRAAAIAWFDENADSKADVLADWHSSHVWTSKDCQILRCPPAVLERLGALSDREIDDFLRFGVWPGQTVS